jgi:hypothetical protein
MDPAIQPKRLFVWPGVDVDPETDASADASLRQLEEERLAADALFDHQAENTRQFLRDQATAVAAVLLTRGHRLNFSLPESIFLPGDRPGEYRCADVPAEFRREEVAGFLGRLPLGDVRSDFRRRLARLGESAYPAVAVSASLLRFAIARHIVRDRVASPAGEEFTAEREPVSPAGESIRETVQLPTPEAMERRLGLYRESLDTLHLALTLAPCIYTDGEYQLKRAGILSRLIPLGRRLAHLRVQEMIAVIGRRAQAGELNLGLQLSLPYFDERALEMKLYEFDVIPGRTMFVPAFVALAALREEEKIERSDALNPSTRMHLLEELKTLRRAFEPDPLR